MKKIGIVQSNYIPWKGYFDMIAAADEFILFDDVQYTRRDWRNRNLIKTSQGLQWLTVPVKMKGKYLQTIRETEIAGTDWAEKHWRSITKNYRGADYFSECAAIFEELYLEREYRYLSELNLAFIKAICAYLKITTKISQSKDYKLSPGKTERLVDLCTQIGAKEYISGPSAKDYIQEELFSEREIKITWFDYSGYPTYPQQWGAFDHSVSILDLLFNCGREASKMMKHVDAHRLSCAP